MSDINRGVRGNGLHKYRRSPTANHSQSWPPEDAEVFGSRSLTSHSKQGQLIMESRSNLRISQREWPPTVLF